MRSALVLALMAVTLVYGPDLPPALGYREAIWGRGMSLAAATLPLVLLLLPGPGAKRRAWLRFAGQAGLAVLAAGAAFLVQWQTSTAPTPAEITFAKTSYAAAYVALQAALTLAWLQFGAEGLRRWRLGDRRVDFVPWLGAALAGFGAGIAIRVAGRLPRASQAS